MKKSRIFPMISLLLLLGAISLSAYFKNIENKMEAEQSKVQSENLSTD